MLLLILMKELDFRFVKDVPVRSEKDGFSGFYHKNVAPALREILENETCLHTIGLFGRWGTGKSTIIDLMQDTLKYPIFIFDAWKYQEDDLRRIFLIKLVDFLKLKGFAIDEKVLDALYRSRSITTEEENNEPEPKLPWYKRAYRFCKRNWVGIGIVIGVLAWIALTYFYSDLNPYILGLKTIIGYLTAISVVATLFRPVFEDVAKDAIKNLFKIVTPLVKIRTIVEAEERINSPEQFERLFNEILSKVDKRIVIVFDNVDRVQGDTAIKILSTIKTFLDPTSGVGLTFVIPCDSVAINNQIKAFYNSSGDEANFDASEYLRKLFNVIIWTPEFISADMYQFTKDLLNQTGKLKDLLNTEEVARTINYGFGSNPREVKQFINNLVAAMVLASKTEVKEIVHGNPAYLAKVLILKQKYPDAYENLKERWFEPENIESSSVGLTEFMRNTSLITVPNAEPFIYFKKPFTSTQLPNSDKVQLSLIEGKIQEAEDLLKQQSGSQEGVNIVAEYISDLLTKYKNQRLPLLNIFTTHLAVFRKAKIVPTVRRYYEIIVDVLNNNLWQDYMNLPTELIFSDVLASPHLHQNLKRPLIQRYISALSSEELKQVPATESASVVVKDIFTNFLTHKNLLTVEDIAQIANHIEQSYATNSEVIVLFDAVEKQKLFLKNSTVEKFLDATTKDNLTQRLPILIALKPTVAANKQSVVIFNKISDILQQEFTTSPDFNPAKEVLMQDLRTLFSNYADDFKTLPDAVKSRLLQLYAQTYNGIGAVDNRAIVVNNLRWLSFYLNEQEKPQITNLITEFLRGASRDKLESVLTYWNQESKEKFIAAYFSTFLQRCLSGDDFLELIYKSASKENKLQILLELITKKPDHGLAFLRTLADDLPDRQAVLKALLTKAANVSANQRQELYDYVEVKLSKNDDVAIKELAINQIKSLLKTDDLVSTEVGYKFLIKSNYLSEGSKSEIGKELIEFLRQPGKVLTNQNAFTLRAITSLFEILQETPKSQVVYSLFEMIRPDRNIETIDTAIGILKEIHPAFANFEKDYRDLLERLKTWPDSEPKTRVLENIPEFKSAKPTKAEQEYWAEINVLKPST